MDAHIVFRALHFIGVVLWMGGIVACTMCAVFGSSKATTAAARAVNLKIVTPAMVVAFTGGLGMLLPAFTTFYAKQPWMHAKLTLVLVAAALSGVISGTLRRAADQDAQPTGKLQKLAIALALIVIVVVCLAVFRPGARPGTV